MNKYAAEQLSIWKSAATKADPTHGFDAWPSLFAGSPEKSRLKYPPTILLLLWQLEPVLRAPGFEPPHGQGSGKVQPVGFSQPALDFAVLRTPSQTVQGRPRRL